MFALQTLVDDLKGDTHGNFERLLVALATPPAVYDAQEVMRAMKVRAQFQLFLFICLFVIIWKDMCFI